MRDEFFTTACQQRASQTRRLRLLVWLGFCFALSLAACQAKPAPDDKADKAGNRRQVRDELGREVALAPNPQRIVSLAPSLTETLFALGLGDRLVGVTSFCDYPPEAKTIESIGDTQRPSLERIIALKPDLVLVSTSSQLESFFRALESADIPVYVSNPRNLEETINSIAVIGDLTGAQAAADELTRRLRERVATVRDRVVGKARPKVFVMLGGEPLITIGGTSFMTDLVTQAGGHSISTDEKSDYPQYSLETVVARQPEVIFLQAGNEPLPTRLRQTPAARHGHVYQLNDDLLMRPGPRIVDGLEALAEKIARAGSRDDSDEEVKR